MIFLIFPFFTIHGQKKVVCGRVTAFDKYVLQGVEVVARKSKNRVKTNEEGIYCVQCEKNDKLKFKARAFYNETIKVEGIDSANVDMVFIESDRNKKLATGLGYIDKEDLTYAISNLSGDNVDYSSYSDIYEILQARVPGVDVVGRQIRIRGSYNTSKNSQPLFVVDGIYVNGIADIHPSDIQSINVIKDGAAAMYGSRGANGVIVVTTNR